MYMVHVDKPTNTAKVHTPTCAFYLRRKLEPRPDNWWIEGGFDTVFRAIRAGQAEAENASQCLSCMPVG